MKTIAQLVLAVHGAVTTEGMDLSPSDVGHILSLFFEGMVHNPSAPEANLPLQALADACAAVQDER